MNVREGLGSHFTSPVSLMIDGAKLAVSVVVGVAENSLGFDERISEIKEGLTAKLVLSVNVILSVLGVQVTRGRCPDWLAWRTRTSGASAVMEKAVGLAVTAGAP